MRPERPSLAVVLATLARVHERQAEETRRRLVGIETSVERLAADAARLVATLAEEAACAVADPDGVGRAFAAFAASAGHRRETLAHAHADAVRTAQAVRGELIDAYVAQKQLREVIDGINARQRARDARQERTGLDEHAAIRHRRRSVPTDTA